MLLGVQKWREDQVEVQMWTVPGEKGKKGKSAARGWTSIKGTTMMIYKVDVQSKSIFLAVLVILQKCWKCKDTGSIRLYDDEKARLCTDLS